MQWPARALAAAALLVLVAPAAASRGGASLAASAAAQEWLRAHGAPAGEDELAELKAENPEAYAIVKALLTKRSLGLLDPKHPSASFSAPVPATATAARAGAPLPEESFAEPAQATEATPSAHKNWLNWRPQDAAEPAQATQVTPSAHQNWLNWRPQDAAASEEAEVQQVLGAVAQLKAGGEAPREEASSLRFQPQPPPQVPPQTEPQVTPQRVSAQQQSPTPVGLAEAETFVPIRQEKAKTFAPIGQEEGSRENTYLRGIDFGTHAGAIAPQPSAQENTYLKGLGLTSNSLSTSLGKTSPESLNVVRQRISSTDADSAHDYLASFSWGDSDRTATEQTKGSATGPARRAAEQRQEAKQPERAQDGWEGAPDKKDALLAWLGGGSPAGHAASAAKAQAPMAAPISRANPYLAYLQ